MGLTKTKTQLAEPFAQTPKSKRVGRDLQSSNLGVVKSFNASFDKKNGWVNNIKIIIILETKSTVRAFNKLRECVLYVDGCTSERKKHLDNTGRHKK